MLGRPDGDRGHGRRGLPNSAAWSNVPTPTIDMVYALVKQRAVEAGCMPG